MSATVDKIVISLGKIFFKYRNALFPLVFLGLALLTRPGLFGGDPRRDKYACALGVLLALAGQTLRILVIGLAYIIRGGRGGEVYAETLVQTGFYGHSRNPMYVGNYLILIGFILLHGALWGYLVALPFFTLVYYAIVKNEESYLQEKFGREYDEYAARVNRFLPRLKGMGETLKAGRFDWRKVLSKEYGTITVLLAGILALIIWKQVALSGYAPAPREIILLALLFFPLVLFYGAARFMKKTGRLERRANQFAS
jgi:protein-S-isoprenylcysteine O-methyltransferase Ste14